MILNHIHGCILVYSTNAKYTFESLSEAIHTFQTNSIDFNKIPIILIGNKLDDFENKEVSREEAQSFENNNGHFSFYETSAKENIMLMKA